MNYIEQNKEKMKKFEQMINTADLKLANELISEDATFYTPASSQILKGGEGYLSIVHWMRKGFSNVQWHIKDIICEEEKAAVKWDLTGTHDGEFLGIKPTNNKISVCVMNFYYFDKYGKIINDIAAEGMIGILKGINALK